MADTLSSPPLHLPCAVSSACCPRSLCHTVSKAAATPHAHRRSLGEDGALAKRDTITDGQATYPLSGTAPTLTYDATTTFVSTVTVPVTATTTLSTYTTTTIPSTTVTNPSTSTRTLPAVTVTSTYSTTTSTSTVSSPAKTVSACKKVYNVPAFPCPKGVRQQSALSAFELGLLKEYKALAPKAFPTILVSCQGDSNVYTY